MYKQAPPLPAVGRFAPSPTGDLHFGSLVAAVASCLEARSRGGQWLLRIEDIDPPREVSGSSDRIIADLKRVGLEADRTILYQSSRIKAYERACQSLLDAGQAFWCGCSRSEFAANEIYPGTCREGLPAGKRARAVRVRVRQQPVNFTDRLLGEFSETLADSCGDFVIRRGDGLYAYQLAVVVDDAFQGITEVVRGADLLDSTARQVHLQQLLGLPTPVYAHIPVVLTEDGKKLSKRLASDPVRGKDAVHAVKTALAFLGHDARGNCLDEVWSWAMENWSLERVPRISTRE